VDNQSRGSEPCRSKFRTGYLCRNWNQACLCWFGWADKTEVVVFDAGSSWQRIVQQATWVSKMVASDRSPLDSNVFLGSSSSKQPRPQPSRHWKKTRDRRQNFLQLVIFLNQIAFDRCKTSYTQQLVQKQKKRGPRIKGLLRYLTSNGSIATGVGRFDQFTIARQQPDELKQTRLVIGRDLKFNWN